MSNGHPLLAFVFAFCLVGCALPSQWVIVTDCTDKSPIAGASVYTVPNGEAWRNGASSATPAKGGKTDANGVTWDFFAPLAETSLRATTGTSRGGTIEKSGKTNPWTTVRAGAPEQVYACIEKKNR